MKLTERQVELRKAFRVEILKHWRDSNKPLMFCVAIDVGLLFGVGQITAKEELCGIPSIRRYPDNMPVMAWLAKHYPAVSNAMFDGKTDEQCLAIWSKQKYANAAAELKKNMPDRWSKTSWNIVK